MKMITFGGASLKEAEEETARWLAAHDRVIVRAIRILPCPKEPTFSAEIEVDYDEPK